MFVRRLSTHLQGELLSPSVRTPLVMIVNWLELPRLTPNQSTIPLGQSPIATK